MVPRSAVGLAREAPKAPVMRSGPGRLSAEERGAYRPIESNAIMVMSRVGSAPPRGRDPSIVGSEADPRRPDPITGRAAASKP